MLLVVGGVLVVFGLLLTFGARIPGLGRLPGDFAYRKGNFTLYFPLATSLLLSLVLPPSSRCSALIAGLPPGGLPWNPCRLRGRRLRPGV